MIAQLARDLAACLLLGLLCIPAAWLWATGQLEDV